MKAPETTVIVEKIGTNTLLNKPINISLKDCPAPTSRTLENEYYLKKEDILKKLRGVFLA